MLAFGNKIAMNVASNIGATCASALPTHSRSSWGPIREKRFTASKALRDWRAKRCYKDTTFFLKMQILLFSIKMPSRIEILRAAPNHMIFCTENTLLVFPKHMTATHHAAVLGHAHFLTHKRHGAFIYLLDNGVVLLKPFRRYFLEIFHSKFSD